MRNSSSPSRATGIYFQRRTRKFLLLQNYKAKSAHGITILLCSYYFWESVICWNFQLSIVLDLLGRNNFSNKKSRHRHIVTHKITLRGYIINRICFHRKISSISSAKIRESVNSANAQRTHTRLHNNDIEFAELLRIHIYGGLIFLWFACFRDD